MKPTLFYVSRPSVEQTVDLYAPKLNGPGGDATVHLRVRCCEPGGKGGPSGANRSISAPNVMVSLVCNAIGWKAQVCLTVSCYTWGRMNATHVLGESYRV